MATTVGEEKKYNPRLTKVVGITQCCGSGSALILVGWIRIWIQVGKNDKLKIIVEKCSVLKPKMFSFECWRFIL
jgi:hypothetical protein